MKILKQLTQCIKTFQINRIFILLVAVYCSSCSKSISGLYSNEHNSRTSYIDFGKEDSTFRYQQTFHSSAKYQYGKYVQKGKSIFLNNYDDPFNIPVDVRQENADSLSPNIIRINIFNFSICCLNLKSYILVNDSMRVSFSLPSDTIHVKGRIQKMRVMISGFNQCDCSSPIIKTYADNDTISTQLFYLVANHSIIDIKMMYSNEYLNLIPLKSNIVKVLNNKVVICENDGVKYSKHQRNLSRRKPFPVAKE